MILVPKYIAFIDHLYIVVENKNIFNDTLDLIFFMISFREFANKLSLALLSNSNIPLQKLDLSHNPLEDKGESLLLC